MDDDAGARARGREGVRLTSRAAERDGHPIGRRPATRSAATGPSRPTGTVSSHAVARPRRLGAGDEVGQLGNGIVTPDRGVLEDDVVAGEDELGGGAEQPLRMGRDQASTPEAVVGRGVLRRGPG